MTRRRYEWSLAFVDSSPQLELCIIICLILVATSKFQMSIQMQVRVCVCVGGFCYICEPTNSKNVIIIIELAAFSSHA